jgi:hypothetical protein
MPEERLYNCIFAHYALTLSYVLETKLASLDNIGWCWKKNKTRVFFWRLKPQLTGANSLNI